MCSTDIFLGFLAILFPPIAVWVKRGICSADSLINLALCCLGVLPGVFHAWYIIATYPDPYEQMVADSEQQGAGVTYYYVQTTGMGAPQRQQRDADAPARGYGTVVPERQFPGQQRGRVNSFSPRRGKPTAGAGEGGSAEEVPPTYSEAIQGDNKVQK